MAGYGTVTVRTSARGGNLLPQAKASPADLGLARRRIVLLIHGFNTNQAGAEESYGAFVAGLEAAGRPLRSIQAEVVGFLWPGDINLGLLSFLSYPTEIQPAIHSAERLLEYLRTVRGPGGAPVELILVCHSLGNRVGLELLRLLAGAVPGNLTLRGMSLMAAAVPVPMVEPGKRLNPAALLTRTLTLYSPDDSVLRFAFPLGQTAAGEGWMPQAIGREGNPAWMWQTRLRMWKGDGKGYGHGDYWKEASAAVQVARFLGTPLPPEIAENGISPRELPDPPALPEREPPGRSLPPTQPFG